jgi:hypothetical protein
MKAFFPLLQLFLIFIMLSFFFFLLPGVLHKGIPFNQASVILSGSFLITIVVLLLFMRGADPEKKNSFSYTLLAISLKFILYFALIITVFFLSKNRSLEFVLTFFVIYLSFTSYLMFSILKILKTKKTKSR